MNTLLSPVAHALAGVLALAHHLVTHLGAAPGSAAAWLAAIALLVAVVRSLVLPLVLRSVRDTHARAHARPALLALQERYAGRRDLESLQQLRAEQRDIHVEHGISGWSLAPALLQLPLLLALYRVVSDITAGHPFGALDAGLVASAASASVLGLHLSSRLGPTLHLAPASGLVLLGVALVSAVLSLATQRWFVLPMTDPSGQPALLATVQQWMPVLSATGVLVSAFFVPAGVLLYWALGNLWVFVQQGLVWRFAPTPGSPAALRRAALRGAAPPEAADGPA